MLCRSLCRALGTVTLSALTACGPSGSDVTPKTPQKAAATSPPVVEVKATEYSFTGPSTFPSGWVTLRLANEGKQTHFLLLTRLPEHRTFDDYAGQVSKPFNELYVDYRAGKLTQAAFFEKLLAALPKWYGSVVQKGGPGFTAPGHTTETTVFLEPGDYVMECYVRAREQGDHFHGALGMLRPLIVTKEASGATPPKADIEITLSNLKIAVHGELSRGNHTARVRVAEDPDGLIRHNVHLARLPDGIPAEAAAKWLDWVDAMLPPAPVEFLGGAGQSRAGSESYLAFSLEPGRYVWVSEAWGIKGMVKEFTVE